LSSADKRRCRSKTSITSEPICLIALMHTLKDTKALIQSASAR
jgi:hypothetical protein